MKKILFLLLFITGYLQAQTLQNPSYGNTTTNTLKIKTPATVTSVNFLSTNEADGSVSKIAPINVTIPYVPSNYTTSTQSIGSHLAGIDTRLGQISSTTAGITQRVYFTADNTTVTAGTFFTSSLTGKGSTATGSPPALVLADNTKGYFTKDIISVAFPSATIGYAGSYTGQLTVSASPTPVATQQRFTIEIYRTNNGGTPIASGVSGAPTGDLGVTVVAILDSGILNLTAGSITNIPVTGILTQNITLNIGERLSYHVSAAKIGTGGGNVTFGVYYGSSYNSYYDVPVAITTDAILNKSAITGVTSTDALNYLNANKANDANVIHTTGNESKSGILSITDRIQFGTAKTTYGQAIAVSKTITSLDKHIIDDYSILTPTVGGDGFGVFDVSTEMNGLVNNNHFMAYQSRMLYNASGNLTDAYGFTGFFAYNTHTGSGTITNAHGVLIKDVGGTKGVNGNITNNYGLKIENIQRGQTNYAIDSDGGNWRNRGDIYVMDKGVYSYGAGFSELDPNRRYMSIESNASGSTFNTAAAGTETQADFLFRSKYEPAGSFLDVLRIRADNGNVGLGTNPTTYGTFKTLSINGAGGGLIEFKTNDVFKAYISNDNTSFDIYNGGNTPINFITNTNLRGSFSSTGVFRINGLSGAGNRIVVADASGNLSATNTDIRPYKVYTALLTQTGTSAPTATVLENTLGGTVVWSRSTTGVYLATLTGAFVTGKTALFGHLNQGSSQTDKMSFLWNSANVIQYQTKSSTDVLTDGIFGSSSNGSTIEIRVYN